MTRKRSVQDETLPMAALFDLPTLHDPPEAGPSAETSPPAASSPSTPTKPRKARTPSKTFRSRKAKKNWTYDRDGVMALYRMTRNTVANWIRKGLPTIPGDPVLFRGRDLNNFHQERRDGARLNLPQGYFLCFHCKKVSSLKGEAAEVRWRGEHAATLGWSCPACGKTNATYFSRSRVRILEELGVNLTCSKDDYTTSRRPGEIVQFSPKSEVIYEPVE
jgi:hypothetical protein